MRSARLYALIVGVLCGLPAVAGAANDAGRAAVGPTVVESASATEPAATSLAGPTPSYPGDPFRSWFSASYTYGWVRGASSPPLLTATPVGGGPPTVLFPNESLNGGSRSGFQVRGGLWLDAGETFGVEAGTLYLCESTDQGEAGNTPGTVIGRPFFNAQLGAPDVEFVSVPGALSGASAAIAASSNFCAADLAIRKAICCDCRGRLDWLVGYRFLSFDDSIQVVEDLRPLADPFPAGSRLGVADGFTARNRFHGLLVGLAGEYRLDPWFVEGRLGVSFGRTERKATIAGQTFFDIPPDPPVALPGGLLALSTNSGNFSTNEFTIVPEGAIRVGYQLADNLRVFAGYSVLCWPNVYRAAHQIDPAVNPDLLPPPVVPRTGPARPLFPDRTSVLWAQFLSVGVEFRY